jgi:hypothetical protein
MKELTWLQAVLVGGVIAAAAACSDHRSASNAMSLETSPRGQAAIAEPSKPVPITVAGCLQQSAGDDFILTTINEPIRAVGTSGNSLAAGLAAEAASNPAGVVEREQLRSAAGAYRVDPADGMDLKKLVGKEVQIVGIIEDNSDLPRANENHHRVSITEDELTRVGATAVSTVAQVCRSDQPAASRNKASAGATRMRTSGTSRR